MWEVKSLKERVPRELHELARLTRAWRWSRVAKFPSILCWHYWGSLDDRARRACPVGNLFEVILRFYFDLTN